jgi:hypothetical protein
MTAARRSHFFFDAGGTEDFIRRIVAGLTRGQKVGRPVGPTDRLTVNGAPMLAASATWATLPASLRASDACEMMRVWTARRAGDAVKCRVYLGSRCKADTCE